MFEESGDRKLCIICSKGSLDMAYPGMVLANAALMEGIDVTMFFTFWGMDMITDEKMDALKCTPLGNPSMGMPNGMGIPNVMSMLPGMTDFSSSMSLTFRLCVNIWRRFTMPAAKCTAASCRPI
jgi:peroxiredoxin family protein